MFARYAPSRKCWKLTLSKSPPYNARRFTTSTSSSTPNPSTVSSKTSSLALISSELDNLSPGIPVDANQIKILQSPAEFYSNLKAKILDSKKKIFISTLYIGKTEHELIDTLAQALRNNSDLKLSILTDALRGTRETPNPSCASLLAPLIQEFGQDRVEIRMFHTPNLTGIRKAIIPKRINEGWGLQHMKLYGFDDELILSGANLSEDYFTNRQDRYHVFQSKNLTEYFQKIHDSICTLSFKISPSNEPSGYTISWPDANPAPSPLTNPNGFRKDASKILAPLLKAKSSKSNNVDEQTIIYPVMQFTPLLRPDTSNELPAIRSILSQLAGASISGSKWTFTAGYFNMTPSMRRLLFRTNPEKATVISASPWANGFYQSPGISGLLPAAYTHLSKVFVEAVRRNGLSEQIKLREWRNGTVNQPNGWTYHAKGFWITLPGDTVPSISIIGSSNYTKRSYELDLEANVVLVTKDEGLKKKLAEEESWLQRHTREVGEDEFKKADRKVGINVRLAMWAVRILGGAL